MFLITAQEIAENFEFLTEGSREKSYRIGGTQLLKSAQFAVTNRKRALDRMEHALTLADFQKNRSFLSWLLPSARLDASAIAPLYREPIENDWGNIPEGFLKLKKRADRAIGHLEAIHRELRQLVEATDAEMGLEFLKAAERECDWGYSVSGWSITPPESLRDPEFEVAVREHKHKVLSLKSRGLLDAFIEFNESLKRELMSYLLPRMPLSHTLAHVLRIQYEADTLSKVVAESRLEEADKYQENETDSDMPPCEGVIEARPGLIQFWWMPGNYYVDDKVLSEGWESQLKQTMPTRAIMAALYEMHLSSHD
jgi:hypothetical protein